MALAEKDLEEIEEVAEEILLIINGGEENE